MAMLRWAGVVVSLVLFSLALLGFATLDETSTGGPALMLGPLSAAFLAVSILAPRMIASILAAVGLSLLITLVLGVAGERFHQQRFGGHDGEGMGVFLYLMILASIVFAPLAAWVLSAFASPRLKVRCPPYADTRRFRFAVESVGQAAATS